MLPDAVPDVTCSLIVTVEVEEEGVVVVEGEGGGGRFSSLNTAIKQAKQH